MDYTQAASAQHKAGIAGHTSYREANSAQAVSRPETVKSQVIEILTMAQELNYRQRGIENGLFGPMPDSTNNAADQNPSDWSVDDTLQHIRRVLMECLDRANTIVSRI